MAEPLEETAKREFEKVPEEAKVAAKAPSGNYFDLMAQQFKLTKEVSVIAAKVALPLTLLGGANLAGYALFGIDAIVTSGGFIAGDWLAKLKNKEKITMKDTVVRGIGGTILGGFLHYVFPLSHYLGNSAGAAVKAATCSNLYGTATQIATKSAFFLGPIFPTYIYIDDVTRSLMDPSYERPRGKEFWKSNWRAMKVLGVPVVLNANFTKQYLGPQFEIPIAALLSAVYGFISAKPKEKPKEAEQKVAPAPGYSPGYYTPQPGFA